MKCLACERHILYRIIIRLPNKNITIDKHMSKKIYEALNEALTEKTKTNEFKIGCYTEYEENTVIIQIIIDIHVTYNKNKKIYNENTKKIKQAILEYTKTEFKDPMEGFIEEFTTNDIIPLVK